MCQVDWLFSNKNIIIIFTSGSKKLNDGRWHLRLYLNDGFEIDEDEILLSSVAENRILVLAVDNDLLCNGWATFGLVSVTLDTFKSNFSVNTDNSTNTKCHD